jgi:hypothetical protein
MFRRVVIRSTEFFTALMLFALLTTAIPYLSKKDDSQVVQQSTTTCPK